MKKFCVMPWYSTESQHKTGVCCWINRDTFVSREQLQQDLINNKLPVCCNRCWESEEQGLESKRQLENKFLDFALDRDIDLIMEDAINGLSSVDMLLQVSTGTLCNGTCVTCNPMHSSAWRALAEVKIQVSKENVKYAQTIQDLNDKINWNNVKRINLLGGEPLLSELTYDILDNLLSNNNTGCLISIVTNGSIKLNQRQTELLRNFTNISVCVSIDGVGQAFDYLRYPLKWDQVLNNINDFKEIFAEVTSSFTVSNLNYHLRSETIQWFRDNNIEYIENRVLSPEFFNVNVQPGHKLWNSFVNEVKRQDMLKGIDISDYIPYIAQLIKDSDA